MKKKFSILIVAEIGVNHEGCMSKARELIRQAHSCGADLAKFQLYSVDALFPDKQIIAQGRNWYDEVKRTELTKGQVFMLADYCKKVEIEFLASAFDLERLGWLEEVGVRRHKVASRMNKNKELIDAMIATGKEILLSCNCYPHLAWGGGIGDDFYTPNEHGFKYKNYRLLYCIPEYPTLLEKLKFPYFGLSLGYDGFSDHTIGIEASMVAMSRGAIIIEKHFTLDRGLLGPDQVCSVEPDELGQLVKFARKVEKIQ